VRIIVLFAVLLVMNYTQPFSIGTTVSGLASQIEARVPGKIIEVNVRDDSPVKRVGDPAQCWRRNDPAERAGHTVALIVRHDEEHIGAPVGGTTRGGHQGVESFAFSLRWRQLFPIQRGRGALFHPPHGFAPPSQLTLQQISLQVAREDLRSLPILTEMLRRWNRQK
jgi:hypothetical protein